MSIKHDDRYHGQEYIEGQDAADVPDREDDAGAEAKADNGLLRDPGPGNLIQEYSRVVIIGNYGLLCGSSQTLQYRNITLAQARKLKWDFFGVCPSTMTCYDQHGAPVHEE